MENIKASIIGLVVVLTLAILFTINSKLIDSGPKSNWEWSDDWNSATLQGTSNNNNNQPPIDQPNLLKASSFEQAKSLSEKNNKQILLVIGASWCKWCEKMDKETFTDEKVKNALTNFVVLKINADKDSEGVVKKFQVSGLPTCVITNANEFKVKSKSGFMNANDFLNWLK